MMANSVFASLRRFARQRGLNYKNSVEFRNALDAVFKMVDAQPSSVPDPHRAELDKRVALTQKGLVLQRSLELDYGVQHNRSVAKMISQAAAQCKASASQVDHWESVNQAANLAKHKSWRRDQKRDLLRADNLSAKLAQLEVMLSGDPTTPRSSLNHSAAVFSPRAHQHCCHEPSFEQGLAERLDTAIFKGRSNPPELFSDVHNSVCFQERANDNDDVSCAAVDCAEAAAVKLQACYRGYFIRRQMYYILQDFFPSNLALHSNHNGVVTVDLRTYDSQIVVSSVVDHCGR